VSLERGPISLVNTTEKLLGRNSSFSGLEIREYGTRDPSHWPHGTLYPQKLALTSPASCGRPVGIVRSRTQATEFSFFSPDSRELELSPLSAHMYSMSQWRYMPYLYEERCLLGCHMMQPGTYIPDLLIIFTTRQPHRQFLWHLISVRVHTESWANFI
jgi:hypothetical protein